MAKAPDASSKAFMLGAGFGLAASAVASAFLVGPLLAKLLAAPQPAATPKVAAAAGGGSGAAPSPSRVSHRRDLVHQVDDLRAQLARAQAQLTSPATALRRRSSLLADGSAIALDPAELAAMQAVFNALDQNRSGDVERDELLDLFEQLGEPLTESEADEIMESLDPENRHAVTFPAFVRFWKARVDPLQDVDDTQDAAARLRRRLQCQARFKMLRARLSSPNLARISTETEGEFNTLQYRYFFTYQGQAGSRSRISPWHDIPLRNADGTFNLCCEIPKWTRRKYEIATREELNPIKQDTKNGTLRSYVYGDMPFNYGAFPQTWEDPEHINADTQAVGDNDPLDVIDIGVRQYPTGSIVRVKPVGIIALIDAGETDWKVITISVEDPLADQINDLDDLRAQMPNAIESFIEWLRLYKSHKGITNRFAFDDQPQPRAYAERIIAETHESWKELVERRGSQPVLAGGDE